MFPGSIPHDDAVTRKCCNAHSLISPDRTPTTTPLPDWLVIRDARIWATPESGRPIKHYVQSSSPSALCPVSPPADPPLSS
jgi:hypothetical protein